jgi:hypothetical protein
MARLLLALGLRRFLGDVVALAVAQGQAAALGVLCIAASQRGAPKLAQHLLKELLDQRHVAAAAAMAGEGKARQERSKAQISEERVQRSCIWAYLLSWCLLLPYVII